MDTVCFDMQGLVFFRAEDVALKELLAKWSMAFSKVLMCHLREDGNVEAEMQVRATQPVHIAIHVHYHMPCDEGLTDMIKTWGLKRSVHAWHGAYCGKITMQAILSPEELRALLASAHRPNFVIQMLAGRS